jgi:hypothetical protein
LIVLGERELKHSSGMLLPGPTKIMGANFAEHEMPVMPPSFSFTGF